MLPPIPVEIRYYVTASGEAAFAGWFADLAVVARAKVARALARLEQGNFSNVKSVGEGVLEFRTISGRDTGSILDATARHW
ncbi:MAG: hypothetical protein QOJ84_5603 [Bradyrhizobium sp.]|jgi:putative component of toxin-antitoxin plasmid stabilization module|nr:hypothetical protein [Bradyrhizobium sp.]